MQKILIVVDMQNDFIGGSLGTSEAKKIVPAVCQKIKQARAEGKKICFTYDTHGEDYLSTQEGTRLPVPHCVRGTEGWQLHEDVKKLVCPEDSSYYKGSFGSKQLAEELVALDKTETIEEIELVGLCTDICVISNALLIKAFLPETPICADASCCAGVTRQSHENALEAMKMCQIEIR